MRVGPSRPGVGRRRSTRRARLRVTGSAAPSRARSHHQPSSSSSPSAFSQPNCTSVAEQAQRELALPPRRGVDAVALERGAQRVDRRLLRLGQPRPVQRQVPAELVARPAPGRSRSSRAGPCGRRRPIPRLPIFQSPWRNDVGVAASASTSGARSWRSVERRSREPLRGARSANRCPSLGGDPGHLVGPAPRRLVGHRRLAERQPAVADGSSAGWPGQPHVRAASAAMSSSSWRCCSSGHRVVARRQQLGAGIAHEQRGAEPVAPEPAGHADDGVVDALGQHVHQPRAPHLERDAASSRRRTASSSRRRCARA